MQLLEGLLCPGLSFHSHLSSLPCAAVSRRFSVILELLAAVLHWLDLFVPCPVLSPHIRPSGFCSALPNMAGLDLTPSAEAQVFLPACSSLPRPCVNMRRAPRRCHRIPVALLPFRPWVVPG